MRKHFISLAFVLMLLACLPMQVRAASHKVSNYDELQKALEDTDAKVIINLTGDIDGVARLYPEEDRSYTINENGYFLMPVVSGKGSVVINTDGGQGRIELHPEEGHSYTVNGNGHALAGVVIEGGGSVVINADIEGGLAAGYMGETGEIIVNGDIVWEGAGWYSVFAEDSRLTVNGNIVNRDADDGGAFIDSTVTINGDYFSDKWGLSASGDITINGDVTAAWAGLSVGGGTVKVDGNIDGGLIARGGTVTVTGDISGSSQYREDYYYDIDGSGIHAWNTAVVMVEGNVTGSNAENEDVDGGNGLYITYEPDDYADEAGSITVKGKVKGGSGCDIFFKKSSDYDVSDEILYPTITVGAADSMYANGFEDEELEKLKDSIVETGIETSKTEKPTDVEVFYGNESANKYEIYGVQVAASSSLKNCKICVERLRDAGYNAYIYQQSRETSSYRIMIGVFAKERDAEELLKEIRNSPEIRGMKMSHASVGAAKLNGRGVDTYCDPYY